MSVKFFNPDYEISGHYDVDALKMTERADLGRDDFDADKDCPFDRMLCRQKLVRIINWTNAVEYYATHRINYTFCTAGDMFHACPVPDLNCVRRARYEAILKNKTKVK